MTSVTFTPDVGGDNITIDDSDSAATGLGNGGHRTRFMIALQQFMKTMAWAKTTAQTMISYRDAAATSASQAQIMAAAAQSAAGLPALAGKANKFLRVNPSANGVLFDDVPDIMGAVNAAIDAKIKSHVPSTLIGIHSGTVATIPATWVLCDGQNGTIDLRDKFVLGAGTGAGVTAVGATGGAKTVTLNINQVPSHQHTGTTNGAGSHGHSINDPGHNHRWGRNDANIVGGSGAPTFNAGADGTTTTSTTGISINGVGDHAHTFGTDFRGGDQAHENMPPFYALCFIQKVWP